MSLRPLWRTGGTISLTVMLALAVPVWATIGPPYDCAKGKNNYDALVKKRNDLRKELSDLESQMPTLDQKVRDARKAYSDARDHNPQPSQQTLTELYNAYQAAQVKLNKAIERKKKIPDLIDEIEREMSDQANRDKQGGCPPYPPNEPASGCEGAAPGAACLQP